MNDRLLGAVLVGSIDEPMFNAKLTILEATLTNMVDAMEVRAAMAAFEFSQ